MPVAEARGRGRPPKAADDLTVRVNTRIDPDLHAAWKASGMTLNEIFRAGATSLRLL